MRAKLPKFSELMAGNGLDLFAKYKIYMIDPDLSGPTPGSRKLYSHIEGFWVDGTPEEPGGFWVESRLDLTSSSYKRAYTGPVQPLGSESMPRIYGHRFRTEAFHALELGDSVLISMPDFTDTGPPPFEFNTVYNTGDYVRYRTAINSNSKINRCIAPDTSGTTEEPWNSSITRQSGGVTFIGEANSTSSLNPPVTMYPWKVSRYDLLEDVFIVDVPFDPEKSGGGAAGWIFNTNVNTMLDVGPEESYFAVSKPISISLYDDNGSPTLQPYYYTAATLQRAIRAFWTGGFKFRRMTTPAQAARFIVFAKVADSYTDEEDLPYDQQIPVYAQRIVSTASRPSGTYTDADVIADPVTGELDYIDTSQTYIVMGIN